MPERKSSFAAIAKLSLSPQEKLAPVQSGKQQFFIGLPREIALQEKRISLTPDAVGLLVSNGHEVWIETKAGEGSNFSDREYSEAGAKIVYSPQEVYKAEVILKIEPPTLSEIELMKPGQTLISAIQLGHMEKDFIDQLLKKKVTALAYEFIEDKGGGMPVIRVLSEIAGMAAISVAAQYLSSVDSGRGLVLGGVTGVPSTKMVIIGAGTVAENVARIALSMGAEIQIFDNHLYKHRRIKHLLGQQVYTSTIDTTGLAETLKTADVVIGALRAEKGRVRHVVSEEMVRQMKEGALIIDLSIDQGGCIATSEITTHHHPVFRKYGVIHYCVPNISSRVARTATTALSNFFTPTILRASEEGGIEEVIIRQVGYRKGVYTFKGVLTNEAIASKFGLKHKNIELLIAARIG